jgi:outer membrane protein TolC
VTAVLQAALVALPGPLTAQQGGRQLTLEEAIQLAERNNPTYLAAANNQSAADWNVREAYSNFLPGASANGSLRYTRPGVQRIGTQASEALGTDYLSSSYSLNFGWGINGSTIFGLSTARANADATSASIDQARFQLESGVTLQYMGALRARDQLDVERRRLERARSNLELVQTRVGVGAAAGWEGKQAEVDLGRAEVAVLQQERQLRAEKLRLMEQIGTSLEGDLTLVSEFEVFEPTWSQEELLDRALSAHPGLRAEVARERAARAGLRQARSQYFPTLSLNTGFSGNMLQARNDQYLLGQVAQAEARRQSGYEECLEWQAVETRLGVNFPEIGDSCGSPQLSEAERSSILSQGEFGPYSKNPFGVSLNVSIPIFDNFTRERSVAQSQSNLKDAEYQRRAEELRIRTALADSYDGVHVAYQVVQIEARNRQVAEERLTLARQRYALGAAPIIELLDAETSMSLAESQYLNAVYQFHQAVVTLEAATGGSLRSESR